MFMYLLSRTSAVEFLVNVELEWLHWGQHHNKSKIKLCMGWYCFMVDSHNVCYIFTSQLEIVGEKILFLYQNILWVLAIKFVYGVATISHCFSYMHFFSRSLIFWLNQFTNISQNNKFIMLDTVLAKISTHALINTHWVLLLIRPDFFYKLIYGIFFLKFQTLKNNYFFCCW